ncbi:type II secretion system F family protein [Vibrio nigripulchritudo]|uniref:type II secretion system F family protein n=1 Tax=Vibrio nigripulchritudo TaxID=28173 RepID=UPI0024921494|nr:type II secretion system F family protein [Vibrio nigripulchritudo]BDU36994.1 pilus assembly protein TadB [Vibrio nigripulchritudo]BDU42704.1 pilus assembly protein TadB [Vibrio nigripulchritudo]
MIWAFLIWCAVAFVFWLSHRKNDKKVTALIEQESEFDGIEGVKTVIDTDYFETSIRIQIKFVFKKLKKLLEPNIPKKLFLFFAISGALIFVVNMFLFNQDILVCLAIGQPILFVVFLFKLSDIQEEKFKNDFPDALNILSGAIAAGQSIIHAFEYVGEKLDNDVGKEFKYMAERLLIGEDPDDVLSRSASTFPYVEYFFFISTIRINLSRGGQLKDVITKINRIMFDARALEKKKNAMTSEARSSAKIVACLPVIFLLILRFTSPENYNFVMFEEGGKPIFYYVLFSELIGFFCISMILRSVN